MKCARLQLQDRTKTKIKPNLCYTDKKPLRFCQKRMINPGHDGHPPWADVYERFHCQDEYDNTIETTNSVRVNDESDLFLSVQTLTFQGNIERPKRSRNSFKFKSPTADAGDTHRMFVKQAIADENLSNDGRSSQLTSYYFDDYVKYLFNNEKSRPASGISSIFLQSLNNKKENKATQVDELTADDSKTSRHGTHDTTLSKKCNKEDINGDIVSEETELEDTKITFHKHGRRKSLKISRTQSPETVQVIRVDVVRNNSHGSAMSNYEVKKSNCNASEPLDNIDIDIDLKQPHFSNKYLLTSTIKALDENLSGGEKVTLLCKTFKLSDRSRVPLSNKPRASLESKLNSKSINTSSSQTKQGCKIKWTTSANFQRQIHTMPVLLPVDAVRICQGTSPEDWQQCSPVYQQPILRSPTPLPSVVSLATKTSKFLEIHEGGLRPGSERGRSFYPFGTEPRK